ncbi:MAG: GNAT family N-acetyltransferase [Pseudomonadota bacterium]
MRGPVFRTARADELETLAEIWNASWHSTGVESPETLSIEDLAARLSQYVSDGGALYVVEDSDAPAGLILLFAETQQLSQLFLAPNAQGKGLGQACLHFIQETLPGGFWLTVAEANAGAIRFYEANGLKCQSRDYRAAYDRFDLRYAWAPSSRLQAGPKR